MAKKTTKKKNAIKAKAKVTVKAKIKTTAKPTTKMKAKSAKPMANAKAKSKTKTKVAAKSAAKKTPNAKAQAKTAQPVKSSSKQDPKWQNLFSPLRDNIFILREGFTEKTAGGLYIPATAADRPAKGKVIAVGRGSHSKKGKFKPLDVSVGNEVLFSHYAGTNVVIAGTELLILKEADILGVLV